MFQKKTFRKNIKLIKTVDDKTKDEQLQYDIKIEEAKISALSSGKIHKYEYLTGEKQYTSIGKAFEIQAKTIEDQGKQ